MKTGKWMIHQRMASRALLLGLVAPLLGSLIQCVEPRSTLEGAAGREARSVANSSTAAAAVDVVRLASFNVAEFGEGDHAKTRDLDSIAEWMIDARVDLLAIQEVAVGPGGAEQAEALAAAMTEKAADNVRFQAYVTDPAGDERCAVIYSTRLRRLGPARFIEPLAEAARPSQGGRTFYRIPVEVPFAYRSFDFSIIIVHLHWSNLDQRRREVMGLRDFLQDLRGNESDVIVLGDFNRYGNVRASEARPPFDELLVPDWSSRYRFPLLEAVTEPDDVRVRLADRDEFSTTIAQRCDLYDQFVISRGAFREFSAAEPQFNVHVGIVAFDRLPPFSAITDHSQLKYLISDHRPIWIQFRADLADDD